MADLLILGAGEPATHGAHRTAQPSAIDAYRTRRHDRGYCVASEKLTKGSLSTRRGANAHHDGTWIHSCGGFENCKDLGRGGAAPFIEPDDLLDARFGRAGACAARGRNIEASSASWVSAGAGGTARAGATC